MKIIELIKKQETQSKIALTEEERKAAIAFFEAREAEAVLLRSDDPTEKDAKFSEHSRRGNLLRDDIAAPDAERESFLSLAPDTDGAFVRVPKTL